MQVFNQQQEPIGRCSVGQYRVKGKTLQVPIAYEGEYCEGCKVRHTLFDVLTYSVCMVIGDNEDEIGVIAKTLEEAKYLPGFTGD